MSNMLADFPPAARSCQADGRAGKRTLPPGISASRFGSILLTDELKSNKLNSEKMRARPMPDPKPYAAEVKSRGQLTIPKKIREAGYMEEGQNVTIIPIGDSLLVTPKTLKLEDARRELRRMLRSSGLSLKDLLAGLDDARVRTYSETYAAKKD
jgi:bifunctional DNA-binding transcriptional regulator/antitoxin component of YhaV-PrlF toxin-antitoxin module